MAEFGEIEIDKLLFFKKHVFQLYKGERLDQMVKDIGENGVLVPILVRPLGDNFEVLAGHNRVNAARICGFDKVPYRMIEGLTDDEALSIVIKTNLNQRSFKDLTYRERIDAISELYNATKCQGKRTDMFDPLTESEEGETVSHRFELSNAMIKRYVKMADLIQSVVELLDKGVITSTVAYEIAFLIEREQQLFEEVLSQNSFKVDLKKAQLLKAKSGKLTEELIYDILSGDLNKKNKKEGKGFKLNNNILSRYFDETAKKKDIEDVIEKALEFYFNQNESEVNK